MEPKRLTKAFAEEGLKNTIPEVATESTAANAATYSKGFPATTMTPIAVGGQPPSGKDMNGILYELSSHIAYMNKGGQYKFDADFCEEIGGYDVGAVVQSDDGLSLYVNQVLKNKTNPNSKNSKGWKVVANSGFSEEISQKVHTIASIDALRQYTGTADAVNVKAYYDNGTTGGGLFVADKSDKSSADNGGTVIVSANGTRWVKVSSVQNLHVEDFGGLASADKFKSFLSGNYINLPSFKTRQDFIDRQQELTWVPDGHVIVAQGLMYCRQANSRVIPDLHGWKPVNESFAHFDDTYIEPSAPSSAVTDYLVRDGMRINITNIKNIRPGVLRKDYSGVLGGDGVVKRSSLREYAKRAGRPMILTNADLFTAPDSQNWNTSEYSVAPGLQIRDGVLIRDWQSSDTRPWAVVMLRNGRLVEANKTDGISGRKWIERGAVWSVCFGPTLVRNGSVAGGLDNATLSARAAIGQKANRDIVLIHVEGQTGTSGATIHKMAELLREQDCVFGYNLDGGGSAQLWWRDAYACLSSDNNFAGERKIGGVLEINADVVGEFDTGWQSLATTPEIGAIDASVGVPAVSYRQCGKQVELRLAISGPFVKGYHKVITTESLPTRFAPENVRPIRGTLLGADASPGYFYGGGYISVRTDEPAPYTFGSVRWFAKNSS